MEIKPGFTSLYTRNLTTLADTILNKCFNKMDRKLNVRKGEIKIQATVFSFSKIYPIFLYDAI